MFRTHAIEATANSLIRFVEKPQAGLADRRRKVLLECDGESYDFRSVRALSARFVVRDVEIIKFVCPRCGRKHQSLLFG